MGGIAVGLAAHVRISSLHQCPEYGRVCRLYSTMLCYWDRYYSYRNSLVFFFRVSQPIEPGAALQIAAGAAPLVAPLPGAVGRASAIPASSAAGVGGHPVQGAVYSRPSTMASPPGKKGDHMGIWQSVMCLRVWPALSATAPLPRGQVLQRMPQGPNWSWIGFEGSIMRKRYYDRKYL